MYRVRFLGDSYPNSQRYEFMKKLRRYLRQSLARPNSSVLANVLRLHPYTLLQYDIDTTQLVDPHIFEPILHRQYLSSSLGEDLMRQFVSGSFNFGTSNNFFGSNQSLRPQTTGADTAMKSNDPSIIRCL